MLVNGGWVGFGHTFTGLVVTIFIRSVELPIRLSKMNEGHFMKVDIMQVSIIY